MLRFSIFSLVFLYLFSPAFVWGQLFPLTGSSAPEQFADVSGNTIVWSSNSRRITLFNTVLYTFNSVQGTGLFSVAPKISGLDVVWISNGVVHYNLNEGYTTQLTPNGALVETPQIDDRVAVWTQQKDGNNEIYLCDMNRAFAVSRLTENDQDDKNAQIAGNLVVWQQMVDGQYQIMLYRRHSGETEQISATGDNWFPQVKGGNVVWESAMGADYEIFYYDTLAGETRQITDNDYDDRAPQTDFDHIVWRTLNGNAAGVALHKISANQTTFLTENRSLVESPQMGGRYAVWSADGRIELYDTETGQRGNISDPAVPENTEPCVSGQDVAWHGKTGGVNNIFWFRIPLMPTSLDDDAPIAQPPYPNPATVEYARLSVLQPAEISVLNLQGQTVWQTQTYAPEWLTLPVGQWQAGYYSVRVKTADRAAVYPLVVAGR